MKNNILNQKTESFSEKKLDWITIQSVMKNKFGKGIYESWIKKIEFINEYNDYILISVSTRFIRDWITSRYLDQILQIVKSYKKNVKSIAIQKIPEKGIGLAINDRLRRAAFIKDK